MTAEVQPARRGRPPRLSREAIVAAAARMDIREISMPAVAAQLGVTHRALYRYFPTKQHLITALTADLVSQTELPPRGERSWEEWLLVIAEALRDSIAQHAGTAFDLPAAMSIAGRPVYDELLRTLLEIGLPPDRAIDASLLVCSCSLGAASAIRSNAEHGPDLSGGADALVQQYREVGYPADSVLFELAPTIAAHDLAAGFRSQLLMIADGIRAQLPD